MCVKQLMMISRYTVSDTSGLTRSWSWGWSRRKTKKQQNQTPQDVSVHEQHRGGLAACHARKFMSGRMARKRHVCTVRAG